MNIRKMMIIHIVMMKYKRDWIYVYLYTGIILPSKNDYKNVKSHINIDFFEGDKLFYNI